jgi:hypothetical protein
VVLSTDLGNGTVTQEFSLLIRAGRYIPSATNDRWDPPIGIINSGSFFSPLITDAAADFARDSAPSRPQRTLCALPYKSPTLLLLRPLFSPRSDCPRTSKFLTGDQLLPLHFFPDSSTVEYPAPILWPSPSSPPSGASPHTFGYSIFAENQMRHRRPKISVIGASPSACRRHGWPHRDSPFKRTRLPSSAEARPPFPQHKKPLHRAIVDHRAAPAREGHRNPNSPVRFSPCPISFIGSQSNSPV